MRLEATYTSLIIQERERVECPRRVRRAYALAIRLTTFLLLAPLLLALFACILHVPLLPIVAILLLAGVARGLEAPLTRVALRLLWPWHQRWIRRRRPEDLTIHRERAAAWHAEPVLVELDPARALLCVGDRRCDLASPWTLEVERAEAAAHLLRLRIYQRGAEPLLLAAALPEGWSPEERLGPAWEHLPRREGGGALLAWEDLLRLVALLREPHMATLGPLPPVLEAALAAQRSSVTAPA